MARKTLATLKAELAAMEEQVAQAEEKAALRIGKLAASEGLLDLDIGDGEWKRLFQEFAGRFQNGSAAHPSKEPAGSASGGTA